MRAVQINGYGGNEVVVINDVPKPALSAGKVLVEAEAAGVNPVDWKIRQGYLQQMVKLQFPSTLGGDFSGVVVEAGEDVFNFKKGDEVYGNASVLRGASGSFADFISVGTQFIGRKPKNANHDEAAGLPLAGASALQATEQLNLSEGKKILIHGGSGGIGSIAIQLAKHLGAYVATTVRSDNIQFVKEMGADEVVDYTNSSFEDILHDYDAVFDTVGGETYKKSFKVLKKGGMIISMLEKPDAGLMEKFGVKASSVSTQINADTLSKLTELVEKGTIKVHVDKMFPLEQTAEALDHLQTKHPRGKVVITISS
ncbi:MAG: NADP-dependent oxidoreductase [Candidatus Aenigmarchaeota archaeon]|nr:NADP-dependent oxidoreductase [Candidatus Aenigmarchaeota archaeon]